MTTAIYCRISRDGEGESVGVQRQEKDCRALAARLGLTVVQVYTDNDTGASDRTKKSKVRHSYAAMIDAVERGTVRHVIAYSNSRLTRRMSELEELIRLHERTGVVFHTVVSGQDDLATADGRMVARIKASVDAAEADRISERMKTALRHKAMSGEPRVTSHRPFGWMPDGKTLDPVESALIRRGVDDLIRGVPLNVIRKQWTEAGVRTPAGRTTWHWPNVKGILTSWRAAGIRTYNGDVLRDAEGNFVEGQWEAIVTMEERERALAMIQGRKITNRREGKYLLTGLTVCECGRRMWGQKTHSNQRSTQYACSDPSRHISITADRLDVLVMTEHAY